MLRYVLIDLTLFIISSFALANQAPETKCNGFSELCTRRYSNVILVGSHDSAFVGSLYDPRVNQHESVTDQLNSGIRFLQAQVHDFAGTLSMCHTSCFELYAGSLHEYLTLVKLWLDGNHDEVVTILLVNGDLKDPARFDTVFAAVGLKDYVFVPTTLTKPLAMEMWPTYGELIATHKRCIVFLDYQANTSVVPYILPEFDHFFETPYDTTDPYFNECSRDRPTDATSGDTMYIVNHFLDKEILDGISMPDNSADFATNAALGQGSIGAQADLCEEVWGRKPSVILVDMFDRGAVFDVQKVLNGL